MHYAEDHLFALKRNFGIIFVCICIILRRIMQNNWSLSLESVKKGLVDHSH